MAPAEFSKFAGILSAALSQHHLLDVYVPEDKVGQKIPTMLDIHGGGWFHVQF